MPRAHLKLAVQPAVKAELEKCFKTTDDVRQRQRLQAVLLATTGQHGYRDIARIVGCATSTFALWLNLFLSGGVAGLLRRESPPGLTSPLAEPKVQEQLQEGLRAGCWRTAAQVAAWLQEAHGIQRAAKSIYRWLGKAGGAPLPRSTGSAGRRRLSRRAGRKTGKAGSAQKQAGKNLGGR